MVRTQSLVHKHLSILQHDANNDPYTNGSKVVGSIIKKNEKDSQLN